MFKKHVGHLIMVSLKYFFDFDPSFSSHILVTGLVLAGFFKLFVMKLTDNVYEGILTVKEDSQEIRTELLTLRDQWSNSPMREALLNNARSFKNNLSGIDIRNWRLK